MSWSPLEIDSVSVPPGQRIPGAKYPYYFAFDGTDWYYFYSHWRLLDADIVVSNSVLPMMRKVERRHFLV